jgi:ankyrin repeat protein
LKLLHKHGASIDMHDNANWTPLAYAVGGKQENPVNFLLSNGADPKVKFVAGVSIVNLAVEQRFEKGLKALLQAGAEPPITRARSQS